MALSLAALPGACSNNSKSDDEQIDPPTLVFEGAENANSETFEREEDESELRLSCEPYLTFLMGPSEDRDGRLDNWLFRPPGACPQGGTATQEASPAYQQCGYILLELLDEDEDLVHEVESASLAVVVDLSEAAWGKVRSVRATLYSSKTGNEFEYEEQDGDTQTVSDTWEVTIDSEQDCVSMGGASMGGASPGGAGGSAQ